MQDDARNHVSFSSNVWHALMPVCFLFSQSVLVLVNWTKQKGEGLAERSKESTTSQGWTPENCF